MFEKTVYKYDELLAKYSDLQEEIKELKADLEMYENGVYFSSENDILQNRIDKALKYIEEKADYPISYYHCLKELRNILKGDSSNE